MLEDINTKNRQYGKDWKESKHEAGVGDPFFKVSEEGWEFHSMHLQPGSLLQESGKERGEECVATKTLFDVKSLPSPRVKNSGTLKKSFS